MKTHNYSRQVNGENYVLGIEAGDRVSMTAYGAGIQVGDYILLKENARSVRYQVEQIEYYCDQPDLWIGLLARVVSR